MIPKARWKVNYFTDLQSQKAVSVSFAPAVQSQQTQNICITFVQRRPNVFDAGPTLYKCYTNVLFAGVDLLLTIAVSVILCSDMKGELISILQIHGDFYSIFSMRRIYRQDTFSVTGVSCRLDGFSQPGVVRVRLRYFPVSHGELTVEVITVIYNENDNLALRRVFFD